MNETSFCDNADVSNIILLEDSPNKNYDTSDHFNKPSYKYALNGKIVERTRTSQYRNLEDTVHIHCGQCQSLISSTNLSSHLSQHRSKKEKIGENRPSIPTGKSIKCCKLIEEIASKQESLSKKIMQLSHRINRSHET